MRPVERKEIVDYVSYNEHRAEIRKEMMEIKQRRRVHLGDYLTFLFENRDTVRHQIQEMMRAEQIVKESDIEHEIATYNELLGGPGELGCTLLIEIEDPDRRAQLLKEWTDLPERVYVKRPDGKKVYPRFDPRQVGEGRLSSVQYLKFDTAGEVPTAVGCERPSLEGEVELGEDVRAALRSDLES